MLRIFDKAKIVIDSAGLVLRGLSLASAGVSLFMLLFCEVTHTVAIVTHLPGISNMSIRRGGDC